MTDYLEFKANLDDPEVAESFDDFSFWSSVFGQLLFRCLHFKPGLAVLDVGCGTGFPLLELADRLGPSSSVEGIDSWARAVARARKKARVRGLTNVRVRHGDAASLPYSEHSFDLIVSNLGVNNFENPSLVMSECFRVCKPGGRIVLTTNLAGHMREFYQLYEETLIEMGNTNLVDQLHRHEAHRATIKGLHELFSAAGFEVTNSHTETFELRYADGSALLRAYLSRLGFLEGWRSVVRDTDQEVAIFEELEARLNRKSREGGEGLSLSIPAACVTGRRNK